MAKIHLESGDILLHEVYKDTESGVREVIQFAETLFPKSKEDRNIIHASIYELKNKVHIKAGESKYQILQMDADGLNLDRLPFKEKIHIFRPKDGAIQAKAAEIAMHWYETGHIDYAFRDIVKIALPNGKPISEDLIKALETGVPEGTQFICSEFVIAAYAVAMHELKQDLAKLWNVPLHTSPAQLFKFLAENPNFEYIGTMIVPVKQPTDDTNIHHALLSHETAPELVATAEANTTEAVNTKSWCTLM